MVVVVARLLPIDEFAAYVVGVSAAVLLVPLADAGMWPLVARLAAHRPAERALVLTAAADRARAVAWSVAVMLAVAGWQLGLWPNGALWLFVVLGALAEAEIDTMKGELIGRLRYALAAILVVAPAALGLLGAFALPLLGLTATSGLLVFAGSRALPALALHVRVPIREATTRLSLREGLPFAATRVLTTAYVASDVLLLSLFNLSALSIAVYGVTYRIVTAVQLIPGSIAVALYPRVATETGPGSPPESTRAAAGLSLAIAGMVVALLFLDLPLIFSVFGDGYTERAESMRPLPLVLLPIALSMVCISGLQGRGHERKVLRIVAAIAAINLAGNLTLIPVLGVQGALIATSAAEWSAATGAMLLAVRHCDLRRRDLRVLVGVGLAVLSFFPAIPNVALAAGIVLWLGSIWFANDLDVRVTIASLRAGLVRRAGPLAQRTVVSEADSS